MPDTLGAHGTGPSFQKIFKDKKKQDWGQGEAVIAVGKKLILKQTHSQAIAIINNSRAKKHKKLKLKNTVLWDFY